MNCDTQVFEQPDDTRTMKASKHIQTIIDLAKRMVAVDSREAALIMLDTRITDEWAKADSLASECRHFTHGPLGRKSQAARVARHRSDAKHLKAARDYIAASRA